MSRRARAGCAAVALAIVVIAVVSLNTGASPARARALPAARNFTLAVLGHPGKKISLAAFAGRPVIVNFFASWCPPCKRETPTLARFYRESGGRIAMIGVDSNDKTGPALRFVRSAGVRYPVVSDPFPAATTISYGVYGLPQTFFLNARHRIVKRIFGAVTVRELGQAVTLMDKGWRPGPAAAGSGSTAAAGSVQNPG
ncbi:MAG: TlpA disulfide reductase family protein [Streptosporangiaceae bacterium]|jgi:thiol-disulfide isomerase/thioredoxin